MRRFLSNFRKKPGVYFSRLSIILPNIMVIFRKNKNLFEILHWVWHVDFKKLPFSYRAQHWNSNTFILIILVPGSYIVFIQEEITVLKYFSSQCQMPQKRLLCRFIKPLRDSTKKKNFRLDWILCTISSRLYCNFSKNINSLHQYTSLSLSLLLLSRLFTAFCTQLEAVCPIRSQMSQSLHK